LICSSDSICWVRRTVRRVSATSSAARFLLSSKVPAASIACAIVCIAAIGLRNWCAAFDIRRSRAFLASVSRSNNVLSRCTIPCASIDIWQTAPNGLYSSQDPEQDTYSFHGIQTVEDDGRYGFSTVKPVSYEVPTDGPGGALLEATGRHAWRPSHLHFIVKAEGYRTLVSEVFAGDDPYLDQDAVFGVREDLVMSYKDMPAGTFPEGYALSGQVAEAFLQVDFDLTLVRE
jgi:hypothetical protein